jgi:peptidyl-prolyl cis-trans isomerase C
MKKLLALLLVSSVLAGANSFAETVYLNGKPVDPKVVSQTLAQFSKSSPMMAKQLNNPQFKQQVLQSIGMQQAILAEGNSQGLDKTAEYQQKMQEIKPMIYAQILQEKSASSITNAEIQAKYNQMKQQALNAKQYEVSHILVKDQKTADSILAQLKKGGNFADLAKKYSIDPGSKAKGGDLGWSDGNNYVPEFTKAVQGLKKGQYTAVAVRSQFGFHIIKLNDVKASSNATQYPSLDKMKDQIKQQLQMEKSRQFFESLKIKYKVEVKQ